MPSLQRISMYSAVFSLGGYYILHSQLEKKYPDIALYDIPPSSQIKKHFPPQGSKTYVAYCDTFKRRVTTDSPSKIASAILAWPTLKNISEEKPSSTGSIRGNLVSHTTKKDFESVVLKFYWNPSTKIVPTFEWLASYGYPWRMMNGGYHEILVQNVADNTYDVYFVSAHEYNNLRDGKTIPGFVQVLHRDFARLVLHLTTGNF